MATTTRRSPGTMNRRLFMTAASAGAGLTLAGLASPALAARKKAKAAAKAPAKAAPASVAASPAAAIADKFPSADEKEWGQLRWILNLAAQAPEDFKNYRWVDEVVGPTGSHYTIAFSVYMLAVEQYHKFPAWQDALRNAMDRLNEKMLQKLAWRYWEKDSRGVRKYEPNLDLPYPYTRDPIALRNVMYSGHLGQMINLYQMLYDDRKWDKPSSITLKWDDKEQFVYDNRTLQDAMFLQALNNPVPAIDCEPNAVFPACNTHSMLSWKLYDHLHGTRYFSAIQPLYDRFFERVLVHPKTNEIAPLYLMKQGFVFAPWNPRFGNKLDPLLADLAAKGANFNSPTTDAWTGTFMHAWAPQIIERLYPAMKQRYLRTTADGGVEMIFDPLSPDHYVAFFAALAAELGDEPVRNALLAYADRRYSPKWIDGTYHYPFEDSATFPRVEEEGGRLVLIIKGQTIDLDTALARAEAQRKNLMPRVKDEGAVNAMKNMPALHSDVTDRLLALARALPKNGLWTMHNKPFDRAHFNEPQIAEVDVTQLGLKRAHYDRQNKALVVSTFPSKAPRDKTTFKIVNLDPSVRYTLRIEGQNHRTVSDTQSYTVDVDASVPRDILVYPD